MQFIASLVEHKDKQNIVADRHDPLVSSTLLFLLLISLEFVGNPQKTFSLLSFTSLVIAVNYRLGTLPFRRD